MSNRNLAAVIEQTEDLIRQAQALRSDLTEEQKAEALRIGRISDQFKSAGATRKR